MSYNALGGLKILKSRNRYFSMMKTFQQPAKNSHYFLSPFFPLSTSVHANTYGVGNGS